MYEVFMSENEATEHAFILIIDDSLTVRKILETCLGREGYEVKSFVDGVEALLWLVSPRGKVPALIFLDLTLPRLDGLSVLRSLKQKSALAAIPVVVLSRREGVLDRLKARLAGASVYLTKPFKTSDILAVVSSSFGQAAGSEPLRSWYAYHTVEGISPAWTMKREHSYKQEGQSIV